MVRVALAQINTTVGDLRANAKLVEKMVRRAADGGAAIVAFPELTLSGYPPEDLLFRRRFVSDCEALLGDLACSSGETAVVIGYPRRVGGTLRNAAAVFQGGEIRGVYHKALLPNYGVFDEKRYFSPGEGALVIAAGDVRVALHICEDSWEVDGAPARLAAAAGVDGILNISASPYARGKYAHRRDVFAALAKRCDAPVLCVNLVGGQDEVVFDGGSVTVSPEGEIVRRAERFEEDLLFVDVEKRRGGRSGGTSGAGGAEGMVIARIEPPGGRMAPLRDVDKDHTGGDRSGVEEEEIYRAIVLGTGDYLAKNGFRKAVLGVSGGIDSALVAAIACDALGSENVTAVTMPSWFSSRETRADAEELARRLGMEFIELPIGTIVDAFDATLSSLFAGTEPGIAEENLQARTRGNLLMALSNKFGSIVLNTANKSETAVGYSTLYGDMAGGLSVIGDVPKTLVYRLARWRNDRPGGPVIPETILARPPSAELRADQKDSDSLPDYDLLDRILEEHVENDLDVEAIAAKLGERDTVRRVVRLVNRAEYKRRQAPPIIKITPKAFGRDRRLPITNRYRHGDGE